MPTVGWLTEVAELELAFAPGWAERAAGRTVTGAAMTPVGGPPGQDLAAHLVRTSLEGGWADRPPSAARHLRQLAAAGAAALALPSAHLPAALVEAATRHGVPLLTVAPAVSWLRVSQLIAAEQLREERSHLRRLEQLLGHARDQGSPDRRIERLVGWLAEAVEGLVTLTGPAPAGSPAEAWSLLSAARPTAEQVATGRLRSAALDEGGLTVRVTAVGDTGPYPVLTVGRTAPFDSRSSSLVSQAATLLAPLVRLRAAEADRERLGEVAAGLRVGVFQLLMGGEVTLAQRAAEGLARGLLDAETSRVYVLEGPAAERDQLARECAAATEGRALVVRCPATEQHLIVVAPLEPGADADGWDTVGLALRRFAADHPDRYLGGSGPLPLAQTSGSYSDAIRALAVARLRPDRAALYATESRLAQVLDAEAAAVWATAALRPLNAVSLVGRDQLLGTLHLGLEFPATSAGKILGVSRNTVRARLDRAAALLGLDLSEVRARAVLHLALRACGSAPQGDPARPVGLAEVLGGEAVQVWAAGLLRRLDEDGRGLRATLLSWLSVNTGVETAAGRLGLHPQTVRDHLRAAERLLQRQLLSGGGGVYEVALAFAALGELELPQTVHR